MSRVRPEELSALLDGELSNDRTIEVRAAAESDRTLERELELLLQVDAVLKRSMRNQRFAPFVSLPGTVVLREKKPSRLSTFGIVAMLLLARFLPKFTDAPVVALAVQVLAGIVILTVIARLLSEPSGSPTPTNRPGDSA